MECIYKMKKTRRFLLLLSVCIVFYVITIYCVKGFNYGFLVAEDDRTRVNNLENVLEEKLISSSTRFTEIQDITTPRTTTIPHQADSSVKVLLYTYMRSGSTFLGGIFASNPDVYYFFEPLDPIYSAMYGPTENWLGLDIVQFQNGTKRNIPDYEANYVTEVVKNMYECRVDKIPVEIFIQPYMYRQSSMASISQYPQCIKQIMKSGKAKYSLHSSAKFHLYQLPRDCELPKDSPCNGDVNMFDDTKFPDSHICFQHLRMFENMNIKELDDELEKRIRKNDTDSLEYGYLKRYRCLKQIAHDYHRCILQVQDDCLKSKVRVIKITRLTLKTVFGPLMEKLPDLRVVYNIRDPRPVSISRRHVNLTSMVAHKDKTNHHGDIVLSEAIHLCQRIQYDMEEMVAYKDKLPPVFFINKYEDLTSNANITVPEMYVKLGIQMPPAVSQWLIKSQNNSGAGHFTTNRNNFTETANKWKTSISPALSEEIYTFCRPVMERFDYAFN